MHNERMSAMKLWLIKQSVNRGYDKYDSAVVAAETGEDARNTHPDGTLDYMKLERDRRVDALDTWAEPDAVMVAGIGTADPGIQRGSICASFNAG